MYRKLSSKYHSGIYMIIIAVTDSINDNSVAVLSIIPLSLGKFNAGWLTKYSRRSVFLISKPVNKLSLKNPVQKYVDR